MNGSQADRTTRWSKRLLPTISIRHPNRARQWGNDKSKEMHSSMAFRAGSSLLSPRECRRLPPVTALSTPSTTMGRTQSHRAMLCPYLKTDIIELLLNKPPDKYSPHFEVIFHIYLYINIYKYIYDLMNIYVFTCKIHTNIDEACIMKKRS